MNILVNDRFISLDDIYCIEKTYTIPTSSGVRKYKFIIKYSHGHEIGIIKHSEEEINKTKQLIFKKLGYITNEIEL
jgi:hypothetical protein